MVCLLRRWNLLFFGEKEERDLHVFEGDKHSESLDGLVEDTEQEGDQHRDGHP